MSMDFGRFMWQPRKRESGRNDPGFALLNRSHTHAVLVVPA